MTRFLWRAAAGHRLRPWRSPYLRWRIETYWGWDADRIPPADFGRFLWQHRGELLRFLRWAAHMEKASRGAAPSRHLPDWI